MMLPATVHADTAPTWQGYAKSSALSVTLDPDVVFGVNPATQQLAQLLSPLLQQVSGNTNAGSVLGKIQVDLDASNAQGTLNNALTDLTSGHSDSQALAVNVDLLNNIKAVLQSLASQLSAVTGPATTLLSTLSAANPQLASTLSTLTSALQDPVGFLNSLGINVNGLVSANYNNAPAANVPCTSAGLVNLQNALGLSALNLNLAPFQAKALPSAASGSTGCNGAPAQASADNTTTALDIVPTLAALKLPDISNLLNGLLSLDLNQTISSALNVVNQGASAVDNVLAGTPLAGAASSLVTPVTTTVGGVTQTVVSTVPLQGLQTQLSGLTTILDTLKSLQSLLGSGLTLNDLVKTAGVTSTALLHPNAGQVESIATTKLADISVLPLSGVPGASALLGLLGKAGINSSDVSLLHIEGVAASAQTALSQAGNTSPWNDATSNLSRISVLGKEVVGPNGLISVDQLLQGVQRPIDVNIPGVADLQVIISRGLGTKLDTPTDRKSTISALDIQVNVAPGSNALLPMSLPTSTRGAAITGASTSLLHVALGSVASEVTVSPQTVVPPKQPSCSGSACNPNTGLFGPAALTGGGALAGVAIVMQLIPRLTARRRQDG